MPQDAPRVVDDLVGRLHLEELGQLLGLLALELQGHGAAAAGRAPTAHVRKGESAQSSAVLTLRQAGTHARCAARLLRLAHCRLQAQRAALAVVKRGPERQSVSSHLHNPGPACAPTAMPRAATGCSKRCVVRNGPCVWGAARRLQVLGENKRCARDCAAPSPPDAPAGPGSPWSEPLCSVVTLWCGQPDGQRGGAAGGGGCQKDAQMSGQTCGAAWPTVAWDTGTRLSPAACGRRRMSTPWLRGGRGTGSATPPC